MQPLDARLRAGSATRRVNGRQIRTVCAEINRGGAVRVVSTEDPDDVRPPSSRYDRASLVEGFRAGCLGLR